MAATFLNLESGKAFRVVSTEEARELAAVYVPEVSGKSQQQLAAYCRMPDSVLFRVQQVRVPIKAVDLPGPTQRKTPCSRCGQVVRDGREVIRDGDVVCRPCAEGAYFSNAREITWADMNWAPSEVPDLCAPHDHWHQGEDHGNRRAAVITLRRD
jgi:formylmethanofuran dehydrogenase subunit E